MFCLWYEYFPQGSYRSFETLRDAQLSYYLLHQDKTNAVQYKSLVMYVLQSSLHDGLYCSDFAETVKTDKGESKEILCG